VGVTLRNATLTAFNVTTRIAATVDTPALLPASLPLLSLASIQQAPGSTLTLRNVTIQLQSCCCAFKALQQYVCLTLDAPASMEASCEPPMHMPASARTAWAFACHQP
jgi:hypothetical protein